MTHVTEKFLDVISQRALEHQQTTFFVISIPADGESKKHSVGGRCDERQCFPVIFEWRFGEVPELIHVTDL